MKPQLPIVLVFDGFTGHMNNIRVRYEGDTHPLRPEKEKKGKDL